MKKVSNWLIAIWLSMMGYFQVFPEALQNAWMLLPDDLKASIPPHATKLISFALFTATFLVKMHLMRVRSARKDAEAPKDDNHP